MNAADRYIRRLTDEMVNSGVVSEEDKESARYYLTMAWVVSFENKGKGLPTPVLQMNVRGDIVNDFSSIKECSTALDMSLNVIKKVLDTDEQYNGYFFERKRTNFGAVITS